MRSWIPTFYRSAGGQYKITWLSSKRFRTVKELRSLGPDSDLSRNYLDESTHRRFLLFFWIRNK